MEAERVSKLQLDLAEPTVFFRKLKRVADARGWAAKQTYLECILCISDGQEWLATKLEAKCTPVTQGGGGDIVCVAGGVADSCARNM